MNKLTESWRELIQTRMRRHGESFANVVDCTLTEEELNVQFYNEEGPFTIMAQCCDDGTIPTVGKEFTLWTLNRVYFAVHCCEFQYAASVPRNPLQQTIFAPEFLTDDWRDRFEKEMSRYGDSLYRVEAGAMGHNLSLKNDGNIIRSSSLSKFEKHEDLHYGLGVWTLNRIYFITYCQEKLPWIPPTVYDPELHEVESVPRNPNGEAVEATYRLM